jgi:hypothetical protein
MDEGLRRLERETASRPADEQTARRYDRALERSGQRDVLRRRYRFKFLCSLRFEELTPTKDPLVRTCDRCRSSVHFVRTPEELAERVASGDCVAFERTALAPAIDRVAADPRTHSATERRRPCVVPTDMSYVDLDLVVVDGDVMDLVSWEVARTYWVFPLAIVGEELYLAIADPSADSVLRDLTRLLGVAIRPVLATPDAIERAIERHRLDWRWEGGRLLGRMF